MHSYFFLPTFILISSCPYKYPLQEFDKVQKELPIYYSTVITREDTLKDLGEDRVTGTERGRKIDKKLGLWIMTKKEVKETQTRKNVDI